MMKMVNEPATAADAGASVMLSVIINNYNYEEFVSKAIESLLEQEPGGLEIIVVDDCSTDCSRDVILDYQRRNPGRITTVFQVSNSGQGAAFNAGFAASRGDLVMFLDADDFMLPGAAEVIRTRKEPGVTVYHYRMLFTDATHVLREEYYPPLHERLADGDASTTLRETGRYKGTITSGLVFDRAVLEQIMPMDPEAFRYGGDGYLCAVAPLYGPVRSSETAISAYRLHQRQHTSRREEKARLARWRISHDRERYKALTRHAERLGLSVAHGLGTRDDQHLFERVVSVLFEPDAHPVPGETLPGAVRALRKLTWQTQGGLRRFLNWAWWTVFLHAPQQLKYRLMGLKLDPMTRPEWLKKLARFLRRRLRLYMP
ncbi:glycosyltransferase family 2 protein [Hyphomonas sp.]|jgi:glycosyltransferase involved in cell wall biosynthesis|uniref:glycosyltransferase family 2 protein n=1 Tax=Hyphomonas sp. TaxID=87 RepID=UPI0037C0B713